MTARPGRVVGAGGFVPVLLAAVLSLLQPSAFLEVERGVYDIIVRAAGPRPPTGAVVIVDVDESSLSALGQWPWRREVIAELIDRLRDRGASVIALDIVFAESERYDTSETSPDEVLARSLAGGRVVLGYGLTFDKPARAPDSCVRHPMGLALVRRDADPEPPFFRASRAICNIDVLADAAPASGFMNAAPDSDGILRRAPLVLEYAGQTYPSLALAAVSAFRQTTGSLLRVTNANTSALVVGSQMAGPTAYEVPLDGKANLLLRYRGAKQTFPYVSAVDVLEDTVPADALNGKLVLVGTTALGTREVVATPLDTLFTGVEVQATVADNLLRRDFLRRPEHAGAIETMAVIAAGIAATLLGAGFGPASAATGAVVLAAAAWGLSVALLTTYGLYLSPLFPTLGLAGALAGISATALTVERTRGNRARQQKGDTERLMVQTLLSLVEMHDMETGRHSRRTREYTRILAEALTVHPGFKDYLTADRIELLSTLAPLHDIGKVGVPDRVLNKPGSLTPDELLEMRKHPMYGRDVITNAERAAGVRGDPAMALAKELVYTHHERWDGTGYPERLRGQEIPISGRLIAVVDLYDAMRSPRPYHRALTHEELIPQIASRRGTQFDPDVVDAWMSVEPLFKSVSEGTRAEVSSP